jgi:hypothetical protein
MSELAVGSLKGLAANAFKIEVASGSQLVQPGAILQVVSVEKTDTFTTASASFVDIPGLSVSITPSSATSKVLIFMDVKFASFESGQLSTAFLNLVRSSTSIGTGASAGSRVQAIAQDTSDARYNSDNAMSNGSSTILDNPATASAVTYKVQIRVGSSPDLAVVNRTGADADNTLSARTASRITLMEVAG